MKNVSLILLLCGVAVGANAQTKPMKAPARKPASAQSISRPAAAPNTAATGRSNSERLPTPITTTTPPPQPKATTSRPAPAPAPSRRYSNRSPGGLAYQKGDNLLNVGVGLSSYYYGNPLGISFELGVDKDISVGAQFDYNSGNYGDYYYYGSRWRYTATYFGLRGSYHFNRILNLNTPKVDLYAGLGLGYHSFRWNDSNYGYGYDYDYSSGLFFNYFVGGKYYFTDKIGALLELGYSGLSSSRVGLTVKF